MPPISFQVLKTKLGKANNVYIMPPISFQVLKTNLGKANNVTADAAFKSQSKRELLNIKDLANNPAPGKNKQNISPFKILLKSILRMPPVD